MLREACRFYDTYRKFIIIRQYLIRTNFPEISGGGLNIWSPYCVSTCLDILSKIPIYKILILLFIEYIFQYLSCNLITVLFIYNNNSILTIIVILVTMATIIKLNTLGNIFKTFYYNKDFIDRYNNISNIVISIDILYN